jgi:hypothetical protein
VLHLISGGELNLLILFEDFPHAKKQNWNENWPLRKWNCGSGVLKREIKNAMPFAGYDGNAPG